MMAKTTTITREAVFAAADQLMADTGKPPTQAHVRDALGGGSFTTIGPHMKEWEAARAERAEARETPVPDAVQVALAEVAGRLWNVASAEAALGVESARREVEEMRKDAAAEAAASSEAIAIVEGERDAALGRVEVLTGDLESLRGELGRVQVDLRGQIEARTRAETQAEAAAALSDRAEAQAAEAAARADRADGQAKEAAVRADRADADRKVASEGLVKIQGEAANLREAVASFRENVAQLTAERSALSGQLAASEERSAKAEARAEKAEGKAEGVQFELTKTAADLASARADLATERAEHVATRSQLQERMARLVVDHENAEERVKELTAELAEARKSEKK